MELFSLDISGRTTYRLEGKNTLHLIHDDGIRFKFNGKTAVEAYATGFVNDFSDGFYKRCDYRRITEEGGVVDELNMWLYAEHIESTMFQGRAQESCDYLNTALKRILNHSVTKEEYKTFKGLGNLEGCMRKCVSAT